MFGVPCPSPGVKFVVGELFLAGSCCSGSAYWSLFLFVSCVGVKGRHLPFLGWRLLLASFSLPVPVVPAQLLVSSPFYRFLLWFYGATPAFSWLTFVVVRFPSDLLGCHC